MAKDKATKTVEKSKKPKCPITRKEFEEHAEGLEIKIGDLTTKAPPKEFSTGSLGWYLNGKTPIKIGGKLVEIQIGCSLTIIGSKELPGFVPQTDS